MRVWLLALPLAIACGGRPAPVARPAPKPAPAAISPTLADVEAALLAAPSWRAEVTISARGAITALIKATVTGGQDGRFAITAHGRFMDQPLQISWATSQFPPSPALADAIVLGLVRMGLLHNVARLSRGGEPDRAGGGARDWLRVKDLRALPKGELGYRLLVDGEDAAEVVVGIEQGKRGPVLTHRRITVHFEKGDMIVNERYRFKIEAAEPPEPPPGSV
jgi:hypothetical protein